jgi:D-alanyl-D-alanine dipeptidase
MSDVHRTRVDHVQAALRDGGLDYLFITISPDMFYLTGYHGHASERLHLLVIPPQGRPTIIFPAFEKSMVDHLADWVDVVGWEETEDPIGSARDVLSAGDQDAAIRVGISDHARAIFLLRMQAALPRAVFSSASEVLVPMRRVKDESELSALKRAQDLAATALERLRERVFEGRSETQMAVALKHICDDLGHGEGFGALMGSGPNGAMPHLFPTDRVIQRGDPVVIDFWAAHEGYYSDCTRTVHVGPPSEEFRQIFTIVREANGAALAQVRPGVTCASVDRAARSVIQAAGYGEYFTHRVGHGIGIDIHEEPWMVEGNDLILEAGMTFTDEPGIYLPGRFGCRLEDVVAVTESGGVSLTDYTRDIIVVD